MTVPEADLTEAARRFCQRHNLKSDLLLQPDLPIIDLMDRGLESFDEAIAPASQDGLLPVEEPAWGMIRAMILRGFAHAEAGFVCLATGSVATSEVISRVVLESALNVLYVLEQDRLGRMYDYLAAYIKQEQAELAR